MKCEDAGTNANCKCAPLMEEVSRKEEIEQHLIDGSVTFNEKEKRVECVLPLLDNPSKVLGDSSKSAHKIYHRWVAKLNKNKKDLNSVIRSENKLQSRGHLHF